jgi:hypothetical protein
MRKIHKHTSRTQLSSYEDGFKSCFYDPTTCILKRFKYYRG